MFKSNSKTGKMKRRSKRIKSMKSQELRKAIYNLLLKDEHSRMTPGKKETITLRNIEKQIRFLNDSLLNLHKQFVKNIGISISYQTFQRNRPFWVLFPKVDARSTCLCAIDTNNDYIIKSLYCSKIIAYVSIFALLKSLCCNNTLKVFCLERSCSTCKDKRILCSNFADNDTIFYERLYLTVTVTVIVKEEGKQCKKTVKEKVQIT